ncbi:hypothetical protein KsCSTR_47920 [Candidatus Kuenenia stuttgartiensis]|uniref:Plasmid stabilization system protein n=1 Tax=Kuenenia stuttgartiensis TaxID=174633 RepID=A0A6G7GY26_KUEST|nr:type II toxin-antitoxin system RelE/ParE family toxin [Candidatus Kuenenia stuttgartiensis]MCL4728494.1 type II toxin-antitoxin system RelE/ParE family toxin [Candidatus Kuenenia stuttgartiensis]QII14169.1 hypothetical protein KsCSTR_47920 [Candidatus Kuenenia stuttgartiensis]
MKTEYISSFIKDLGALKGSHYYEKIKTMVFEDIPKLPDIDKVKNLRKLKNNKPYYRIRIGEYRIGVRLNNNTLVFMRVLHRKDIVKQIRFSKNLHTPGPSF